MKRHAATLGLALFASVTAHKSDGGSASIGAYGRARSVPRNPAGPDCNDNGVPDDQDIANGTSEDCNGNSVPDECDPAMFFEVAKLQSLDGQDSDFFGRAVSVSGDVVVVGASWSDGNGSSSGSAYVFRRIGISWVQEQKLLANDAAEHDRFGYSVSVFGDVAVVGALDDDDNGTNCGSAYVFRFNGSEWEQEQKLLGNDTVGGDRFGVSVTMSADLIVIGAFGDADLGVLSGSAYVFRYTGGNWVQEQKLLPDDAEGPDLFGGSVSLSGNAVVIGAMHNIHNDIGSGAAYVYRHNGAAWEFEQKLLAADAAHLDDFGASVWLNGDVALVGAPMDDDNGQDSGSAYVFRWNGATWAQEQKLLASDGATGDLFGESVSLSENMAVVCARMDEDNGPYSGSAYAFQSNGPTWEQVQKILPDYGVAFDSFGTSVAVSGNVAVIGSLDRDDEAAFVYVWPDADCNQNGIADACDIADRTSQDCNANDVPDECEQGWQEGPKFQEFWLQQATDFGFSTAVFGDVALVSARKYIEDEPVALSAYSFQRNGGIWREGQEIVPDELLYADANDPDDLALFGDVAVLGASQHDELGNNAGAAYVLRYDGTTWTQEQKLLADDGAASDEFGRYLSLYGDVIAIGAWLDDDLGPASGAVYVYRWNGQTWAQEQKLLPEGGGGQDAFGSAVSVSGDAILVGSSGDRIQGAETGSAYVFRWNGTTWVEEDKLRADDRADGDEFGASLALSGDIAIIGAKRNDDLGSASGSAYIFRFNGAVWVQEQKLLPDDGAAGDLFGEKVALSGDTALVSASFNDEFGDSAGAVYAFHYDGNSWVQQQKLQPAFQAAGDRFGWALAMSGNSALIGARVPHNSDGAAYLFDLPISDCNANGMADGCDIEDGTSLDVNGNGVPDECDKCLSDAECDDGLFCNGSDRCDPAIGCYIATNPCPAHPFCDESADACVDCLVSADCDDAAGCTIDACELGGVCSHTPDHASCDDDLFCTGEEICDPDALDADANGCVAPGDPCFADCLTCDESADVCAPVVVVAAETCVVHDRAGDCEQLLCIDLAESNGVEPRQSGPEMLKFTFTHNLNALTVSPQNVQIACASGSPPAVISASLDGANVVVVETNDFVDQDCCNITFNAMLTQGGVPICQFYEIATLRGDMNFDRAVTDADALLIKPHFGESICAGTLAHPKWDYNLDGAVTGADFALVKPLFGHLAKDCDPAVPCECR